MVLPKRWNEIGRGHLLLRGPEMKPIAQRCVLCHGDNGSFPIFALGSLLSLLAGIALFTLRSLDTLFPLGTGTAAISLYPLGSNLSLGSLLSGWSLFARRSAGTLFAPFSSGSYRALRSGIAFWSCRSPISLGTHRSRITAHTLHAHIARISLGTGIPADTLRSPRTHWTGCTPRSRRSRTALIALYPTRTHGTPFSPRTLFSARSFRSHGSHRSLNGGIGSAGVLSVSPAIAAAILHNNLPLIG